MDFHLPFLGECSVHSPTIPTLINNEKLSYNLSLNKRWLAPNLYTSSLLSFNLELCCPLKFKDDHQHFTFFLVFPSLKHEGINLFALDIDDHQHSMFFNIFPSFKHEGIILFVVGIDDR
jgi:hypothetical protein